MKSIPKIFIWICLIIWLCHPPLFCADIDQVTGLHSISHVSHQVSSNTQITVVWEEPVTGQHNITGYYYQFNGNSAHVFTMDNTSWGQAIYVPKDAPRVAVSTDYSGLDDEPIYCHVAAVDEKQEIMGPTQTAGPYRIDNIAPFPATVIAPAITADSVIALRMGAHHASEMNISSHAYCRGLWEPFQQVKTWQLDDYVGTQILYVCFKDAAGNISQTQAAVWYDSVRANVDLQAAYTKTTQPDPIPVTITFDEKIINFHPADIQVENGLLANFTFQPDDDGYASVFTMTVEPGGQGPVRIKVSENSANDLAQNGNIQAETLTIIYDRTDPTVSLSSDEPMFTHSAGIPVTITFSEPVDGFSGQIKVFNAIPDQFKAVGSSAPYSVYTFILKPASQGLFSAQIEAKKAFDRVGNGNIASSMIAFTYDTTLPNATILASDTDPVSSPLSVTIVFDEYCRLTSQDAIEITNATLTHLSTENTYYTQLSFQLIPNLPGAIDVFLNTNAFYDQAKNKNSVPVSRSFTFDSGNPTVIIGSDIQSPTHLPVIPVWIAFNKPVDQFSSESIGLSNAHITEFKPVSASKYEMNIAFDSPGPTKILIPQGVAQDVSGHTNFPSALFEITYKPNTPHMVLPMNKAFCLEDHTAGPVSIGISDAEGGEYTVFVQTADLLSVDSNHLTLCMTDTCQAMPFQGLTLSAHELKTLQLFVKPLPNANGNTRLTITVRDNLYAVSQSLALGITPINDPPVIGIQKNPIIYTENDMPTIIAQSASVTDIDSPNFANGQLIVDFVQPNAENLLRIKSQGTDPGTISVTLEEIFWGNQKFASFSGGTGISPLLINIENTVADAAAIAELIQCITYENMSERPLAGSFDIRFQLLDGDGGISIPQTNLMTIIPVNDPPEITLSTKTVAYTENQDPVHVSEYARVEDLDAINFQSAVLQIEIIANGTPFDRLEIKDQGDDYGKIGINGEDVKHSGKRVGQWSGGTHYQNPLVVIFNDLATEISIYKVIQAVTFETISDMPSTNERTIQIILTEADGTASETLIRKISVASDNDSPAHHLPFSVVTDEDTPFVFTQNRGIFVTDPDVLDNQLKTTITINDGGTFSLGQTDNLDFLSGDGYRDVLVVTYAKLSDLNQALDGLTFYPTPNFSGTTGITFRTSDQGFTGSGGIPKKADDTILIEVKPVPDPPSISDPGTVIFQEDTSASTSLYLTDVDGGIVTIAVASAYTPLIPSNQISLTGTDLAQIDGGYTILTENNTIHPLSMHIMPSDNQYGETHIILMLTDTDGMAFTRTISVNVLPVNDMPTISAIDSQSTIEDIPSAPIPFSVTDLESTSEAFSFSVQTSEPLKISQITINGQGITRTLQVYPAHDAVGPVQITVTVWDHQEGAASTSFEMELVPVNDIPVIFLEDHSYGQEDQVTIISWSIIDVDGDNLAISAISTNEFLVPDENIILDGANVQPDNGSFKVQTIAGQPAHLSIVVTPLENKFGDANLIFSISDAGGMPLIAKSLLHITPVNDPPTIAPISDQMADEDQFTPSIPIQMSDIDDATINLSLTAQSSNVTLVSDDGFLFEGQGDTSRLSITPKADQNGSATITVMVHDPDGLTAVTHFGLTVKPVNDAPTISPIDDQITAINILIDPIPFTIDDLETPASGLTLTALPSVPIEINFSGTGNDRLLHIINPQNYIGLINIDIVVSDNNLINSTSFTLTITEHNDPPEIQGLSDQTIQEDTELKNDHFQISDIQSSASDLIVTIESMNENLVPNENITLSGVGISRYLSIRPVRNQSGNAIISITVKDPSGLKTRDTFTLTVIAENDPPILSLIPPAACGNSFSLFHDLAGRAFAFGLNHLGQLGIGEPDNQFSPVPVMNNVRQMFAGELHAAAVTSDGTVYVWGNNDFSQLGIASVVSADTPQCLESLNNIQSLALGYHHSLALDQDGKLWAWGTNTFGQTGIDSLEPLETPMPLIHDSDNQTLPLMIAIDAGKFHSVALDHFGTLWTWGYNDWGQLGNGTFTKHTRPERVLDANGGFFQGVVAISAGKNFVLALTNDGKVWAWGENSYGQLGLPLSESLQKYPHHVDIQTPCRAIAAGDQHALALTHDGRVLAWGKNVNGQLGLGTSIATSTPTPVILENESPLDNVQSIAAGDAHSMAILDNGQVMVWGKNSSGQLGDSTPTARAYPVFIPGNDPDGRFNLFTILEDHDSLPFSWMTNDAETQSQNLITSAQSADISMITNEYIAITHVNGGSNLMVTPVPDAEGMADICVSLADAEHLAVTTCMTLFIENINDAPHIKAIPAQTTSEKDILGPVVLTISDLESHPNSLTVTGHSLNPDMLSSDNITVVGSGESRLLFIETQDKAYGTVNIVMTVIDPQGLTQSAQFPLYINDRPDIEAPSMVTLTEDRPYTLNFFVSDAESAPCAITPVILSANNTLIDPEKIDFGCIDNEYTALVLPQTNESGTCMLTLMVSDNITDAVAIITAIILPINDAPVIQVAQPTKTYTENAPPLRICADAKLVDVDTLSFDLGRLSVQWIANAESQDRLFVKNSDNTNEIQVVEVSGNMSVFHSGIPLGTISGGEGGTSPLVIHLSNNVSTLALSRLIEQIAFIHDSDRPVANTRHVAIYVTESDATVGSPLPISIPVIAVNDNPRMFLEKTSIANPLEISALYEKQQLIFDSNHVGQLQIKDPDILTEPLSLEVQTQKGYVSLNTVVVDAFNQKSSTHIAVSGSLTAINTALASMVYTAFADEQGKEVIHFSVNDNGNHGFGGGQWQRFELHTLILSDNDPPQIQQLPDQYVDEDTEISIPFTITDVDGDDIVLTITSFGDNIIPPNNISLVGTSIIKQTEKEYTIRMGVDAFASLTLVCAPQINATGEVPFVLTAFDTEMYSHVYEFSVYVKQINDPPHLSGMFTPMTYIENRSPIAFCKGISLYDPDHLKLSQAVVKIVENYQPGDQITQNLYGNIIVVSEGASYTYLGVSSLIDYESMLDSIAFSHNSDDPNANSRSIVITVNDGVDNSQAITRTIHVSAANDRPGLWLDNEKVQDFQTIPGIMEENQLRFNDEENYLEIRDSDVRSGKMTIRVSADKGLLTLNALGTNALTLIQGSYENFDSVVFQGKLFDINNALNGMYYWASPDQLGEAHIVIQMNDNGFSGDGPGIDVIQMLSFTIEPVNDPPEIDKIISQVTFEDTAVSVPVSLSDQESDPLTVWLESDDTLLVNPSNCSFIGEKIILVNKNKYVVDTSDIAAQITAVIQPSGDRYGQARLTVLATDGQLTETRQFTYSVMPVNDPPEFTVIPSGSFPEALTVYYLDLNPYVLDMDHTDDLLSWTATSNVLDVSINKGLLTMCPPDSDWNGSADILITISDPEGLSISEIITIEITPVPDAPKMAHILDQVVAIGADVPILSFTVTDAEGGNLQISVHSQDEALIPNNDDALSINESGRQYEFISNPGEISNLSLKISPISNIGGATNICVTVTDDSHLSQTDCFNLHMATYLITATAGRHGVINPEGVIAVDEAGAYLPFYFLPDPTYQVDMVIVDGKSVGPVSEYIFFDIRDNHDIRVSFRPAEAFTITSKAGNGGTIKPSGEQTVYAGDNFTFTIEPENGYAIADVRIDTVSIGITHEYEFENISTHHEIAAYFKQVAQPVALFDANPVTGYAPLTVELINQSKGDISTYKWRFGDNSDSGLPSPIHTYASPGRYSVSLTVMGPGGSDTLTKQDYITVQRMPVQIDFQADQRLGIAPLMVQFIESSEDDISSRLWHFGDGHTSTSINPMHTYEMPGNYSVSLEVSADAGTRIIEKKDYIQVLGRKIFGKVTGENTGNQGLSGYKIACWQENTVIAETISDSIGNYTLIHLPVHRSLFVSACPADGNSAYFCQYYNQKDTLNQAESVSTQNSDATGIDFILEPAPDNGISGQIINQSGSDESWLVEIWSEQIGMGRSVSVDASNRYAINGLRPASDYRVYVWSSTLQQFFYYTIPLEEIPGNYLPTTSASAWQAATKVPLDIQKLNNINIFIHSDPFIRGRVLVDSTPLANQWVNAWSSALQAGFGAFTNDQGEYEIIGLLPEHNGSPVSYIVEVQDSPYPYQVYDNQTQRENATLVYVNTDHVDFNLQGGAFISGTVTDFNGLPLNQVTVSAQSQSSGGRGSTVTDVSGNYKIIGLPPASDYIVAVYPVYYPLTYYSGKRTKEEANPVNVSGEGAVNIDFILQKGAIIRGYVYLETMDQPAPSGIWVNVWSEATQTGGDVPTDATGRYEMTGLDAQATDYAISVIAPNYVPSFYAENAPNQTVHKWDEAQGVQPSRTILRNLILTRGVQLSGRVTFDNEAINGVYIEAWSEETQGWRSVLSSSNATGPNYLITGLLPGNYQIRFSHPQYIDISKAVNLSEGENILNMALEKPNRYIAGTILGLEIGTEATITVWSKGMNISKSITLKGSGSAKDYRIDGLKSGTDYRVELRSTHYPLIVFDNVSHWTDAQLIDITNGNASNIDFDLPPPGRESISGTILLPEMPPDNCSIWIDAYSDDLKTGKGIEIDASNIAIDYQISGLQKATDYIVGVWSNIYQDIFYEQTTRRSEATLVDTQDSDQINFTLSSGGRISGYVTDIANKPIYGMIIEAQSEQTGMYYAAVTDNRGYFQMDGLSQATDYILAAHNPGESIQYYSTSGMTVNRNNASLLTLDNTPIVLKLSLIQTGWIKGKVTDETGTAITNIWVSAWSDTAQTGSSAHTDSDGRFTITGLPDALDFKVSVQSIDGAYIDQTRGPIGVYAENILFVMVAGFSFNGTVEDTDNKGQYNAKVVLWSGGANIYRNVQTNQAGAFEIQGLKSSDDYILRVIPAEDSNLSIFQEKGIQLNGSKTRTIVLTEGIRVSGNVQVLDRNSGSWVNYTRSTHISVYTRDNSFLVSGQSKPDGTYAISNIPMHATIILRVTAPGFAALEEYVDTQAPTNEQDLKLLSGATISGCVKDQSGRLIKNARILIRSTEMAVTGISDNQGCFNIAGLIDTVSDYEIIVQADGYISQSKGGKQAGDTVHFTLHRTSPHAITGRILDRFRNVPPESVSVVVKLFEKTDENFGGYVGKTQIDNEGYFSFIGLEAGQVYHIQCLSRLADGEEIVQWAADDDGAGRDGADDYLAGDDFEMIVDLVWE